MKINVSSRFAWLKGCLATTAERRKGSELMEVGKGSELIVDIIPVSLSGGASIIGKYEPQTPLNPPERFGRKLIINC